MGLSVIMWTILAGALATYLTRIGGHVILSRFGTIPPRVEAGLNAVPAAVLGSIVAPYAVFSGLAETMTLVVVALASLRLPSLGVFAVGWACVIGLRQLVG